MAGLPTPGSSYPSPEWALAFAQYEANDAWISDDQTKLQRVYSGTGGGVTRGDNPATHYNRTDGTIRSGGFRGFLSRFFNGRVVVPGEARTRIHAPVASNLAALSADLLMAEPPSFRLIDSKGSAYKGRPTDRLDDIMNTPSTNLVLSDAAEAAAGLSAVALTAQWDRDTSSAPWLAFTPCDAAIPEYIGRRLVAMNLYTVHVVETGPVAEHVYIHVERHEPGYIIHALYRSKIETNVFGFSGIGAIVPLETLPATEHLANIPGSIAGPLEGTIALPTGIKTLTASWWRNRPTKAYRKVAGLSAMGRADFEGLELLLDSVDETWSSWMRDIKIGRARLIVPEQFLELQGPGMGGVFDDDREILTALNFVDLGPEKQPISAHQFQIRAADHAATLLGLVREITEGAGYSLSSYGDREGGGSMTATEVNDKTTLTERTRKRKYLRFDEAAHPLTEAMLELDRVHYGGPGIPSDGTIDITRADLSHVDPESEARTLQFLRSAQAASTDTLVRMQHPDWEESEIKREITLIREELGLGVEPDPGAVDRVDLGAGVQNGPQDPTNPTATTDAGATGQ